jgi:hypothetical protein
MTEQPIGHDADDGRIYVDSPEEVPDFATDEEERAFWRTHTFSPESWNGGERAPRPGSVRERLVQQHQEAGQHSA